MAGNSLFCPILSLLLVFCVLSAGCSGESPSAGTIPTTPPHPGPKYEAGDIIATPSSSGYSSLYVILKYDPATDLYTRAVIEKNADGSWGHRSSDWTDKSPRATVEKTYTVRVGHVLVSLLPIITSASLPEPTISRSGGAPSIAKISPDFAARDTIVSAVITGTNFQNGVTARLVRAGYPSVNATGVSAKAFEISCYFNLHGKGDGAYTLIVTNPDGQSDSRQGIFTIGAAPPVIGGMYPVSGTLNETVPLIITGQNFRNDVKVTFTKDSTELVCDKPLSMESSKISCTLELIPARGASVGEWTVTVLNIRDQQKGTWVKKFLVTNSTSEGD